MAEHLRLSRGSTAAPVATELFHHPDLGSSDLVVVTRDVPGLFSLIAGTLAAHGINIISAQIHTRADGIAIDTFQVNDPAGEAVTAAARVEPHCSTRCARCCAASRRWRRCWQRRQRPAARRPTASGRPRSSSTTGSPTPTPWSR